MGKVRCSVASRQRIAARQLSLLSVSSLLYYAHLLSAHAEIKLKASDAILDESKSRVGNLAEADFWCVSVPV